MDDNISIVESDDLFASDENETRKIKFHQELEPKDKNNSPATRKPVKPVTAAQFAQQIEYKRAESLQDKTSLGRSLAKPILTTQSNNKSKQSSYSRQSQYGQKHSLKQMKKQPKPQNVHNRVIFNNVFYDITQFDIKSNGS
jgi:hypothetical protein